MTFHIKFSIWVVAAVLCAAAMGSTNAENVPSCASHLAPCLAYLNSTSKPPVTCCIPLKMVIENQVQCLCNLFNTTGLTGDNVTQAVSLATRCGISTDLSVCGTAHPPASSPTSLPPTGLPGTPPPVPGTGTGPSGAEKIVASSARFLGVIFFLVSIMWN